MSSATSYPDLAVMIPLAKVQAFDAADIRNCPACGYGVSLFDRFVAALKGGTSRINALRFCGGGKEPTEQCGAGGVIEQLVGRHEHTNPCAGINVPHLHLRCTNCNFERLMHPRYPIRCGGLL